MKQLHSYSTLNLNLLAHAYAMTMCDYMSRCIMTTISISINQLNFHKSFEDRKTKIELSR